MMNCKGFGRKKSWPNFKALIPYSPEKTEEIHEKSQSEYTTSGLIFEPGTSRIRSKSV
jgi:hypothetical protein